MSSVPLQVTTTPLRYITTNPVWLASSVPATSQSPLCLPPWPLCTQSSTPPCPHHGSTLVPLPTVPHQSPSMGPWPQPTVATLPCMTAGICGGPSCTTERTPGVTRCLPRCCTPLCTSPPSERDMPPWTAPTAQRGSTEQRCTGYGCSIAASACALLNTTGFVMSFPCPPASPPTQLSKLILTHIFSSTSSASPPRCPPPPPLFLLFNRLLKAMINVVVDVYCTWGGTFTQS